MAANQKNEIPGIVFGLMDKLDESRGIHHAARGIEEDFARTRMPGEKVKAGGNDFAHIAGCVTATPFDELRGNGICMDVARFTDVIEGKHASGISFFDPRKLLG